MTPGSRAKFDLALAECGLHAEVLSAAASGLPAAFSPQTAIAIDIEERRLLDQAAYRFTKLQDGMGEKVLPGILSLTLDPLPPEATFAEKLQRLERLGALPSAEAWRVLREVRHSLAHGYPDHPELQAAALNRLLLGVGELLKLWSAVRRFVETRLDY